LPLRTPRTSQTDGLFLCVLCALYVSSDEYCCRYTRREASINRGDGPPVAIVVGGQTVINYFQRASLRHLLALQPTIGVGISTDLRD
jgi:hypothetical protein